MMRKRERREKYQALVRKKKVMMDLDGKDQKEKENSPQTSKKRK